MNALYSDSPLNPSEARDEILIGRVIDGVAGASDWRELELAAARDPSVWQRFAASLLVERDLALTSRTLHARAQAVGLPAPHAAPAPGRRVPFVAGLGWAAAALIAALWFAQRPESTPPATHDARRTDSATLAALPGPGASGARSGGSASAGSAPGSLAVSTPLQHALDLSRQDGRWIEELPSILLATQLGEDGAGVEVFTLRRFLERGPAGPLYRLGLDDSGAAAPVPVHLTSIVESTL